MERESKLGLGEEQMEVEFKVKCYHPDTHESFDCEHSGDNEDVFYTCPKCKREIRLIMKPDIFFYIG